MSLELVLAPVFSRVFVGYRFSASTAHNSCPRFQRWVVDNFIPGLRSSHSAAENGRGQFLYGNSSAGNEFCLITTLSWSLVLVTPSCGGCERTTFRAFVTDFRTVPNIRAKRLLRKRNLSSSAYSSCSQ